jgi:hypothetical protein
VTDYTLVLGLDNKHVQQLSWVWPTWIKHKPSLLKQPVVLFAERDVDLDSVLRILDHGDVTVVWWPTDPLAQYPEGTDKWTNAQRCKMLAGFVHVPAALVKTEYWLKVDTDALAWGQDDWIDPSWFASKPAIVCHKWTFTKPPDQMVKLDQWVEQNPGLEELNSQPPLNLIPEPGNSRLSHGRIASWCGFFKTDFTQKCAQWAAQTVGAHTMPVGSQDGYMWYCAKRMGLEIVTQNMKQFGWTYFSTQSNVQKHAKDILDGVTEFQNQ